MRKRVGSLFSTDRIKRKNGEMLIETVIAIAIFALVMLAVSSMIAVSYNMLSAAEQQYTALEQRCADIENSANLEAAASGTLTFTFDDAAGTTTQAQVDVYNRAPVKFFHAG